MDQRTIMLSFLSDLYLEVCPIFLEKYYLDGWSDDHKLLLSIVSWVYWEICEGPDLKFP